MKGETMKHIFLWMLGCLFCGVVNAQEQRLFDEYLREAGDRAEMFVGKMETGYASTVFINHPYWLSDDFLVGEVRYKGMLYKNVLLRYDAFLNQLVVKTPEKQANVYIPMHAVEGFTIGGLVYAKHDDEFMAVHYDGSHMELLEQMRVKMKENMNHENLQYEFKRNVIYYLLNDGRMYEVTNMRSVLKLYPGLEKELKRFSKMNNLNFKENRQSSLVSLVKYADELLSKSLK
jgi:hypothetical protein